jgi:hypothetical protein
VNPRPSEEKSSGFDPSKSALSKLNVEKNPYRVVARKDAGTATALVPVPPRAPLVASPPKSLINKNILAALAEDPDPAASLAGIRKLLVGPTRNLHDAMFEELVTILEESDQDVQRALHVLDDGWSNLSVVTDNLIAESETIRTHTEMLSSYVRDEFARLENASQVKLSEMFMAIDSKIEKMAASVNKQVGELSQKLEGDMKELAASLEKKIGATAEKAAAPEMVKDEEPDGSVQPIVHISLADRLRALRET